MSRLAIGFLGFCSLAIVVGAVGGMAYFEDPARTLLRREAAWHQRIQPGDVVLQEFACGMRCNLVRDLSHSKRTQAGLVLEEHGQRVVWEVFARVEPIALGTWIDRGKGSRVTVLRPVSPPRLEALADAVHGFAGRPPDPDFQWDDEALYSSELVEKAFERAGQPLVAPHTLTAATLAEHTRGVRGITHGKLTDATRLVMPSDFVASRQLTVIVDELEGEP